MKKHVAADLVILQMPVNWFSAPWIYKKYGGGGKFMICATWNGREAFDNPNGELYGGKGTADLFLHITSNYKFMGFDILPDYGVFDIFKNPDIARALEDYKRIEKTPSACTIANIC